MMKRILTTGSNPSSLGQLTWRRAAGLDADAFAELYRAFSEAVFN